MDIIDRYSVASYLCCCYARILTKGHVRKGKFILAHCLGDMCSVRAPEAAEKRTPQHIHGREAHRGGCWSSLDFLCSPFLVYPIWAQTAHFWIVFPSLLNVIKNTLIDMPKSRSLYLKIQWYWRPSTVQLLLHLFCYKIDSFSRCSVI